MAKIVILSSKTQKVLF